MTKNNPLKEYLDKRVFRRTPEPRDKKGERKSEGPIFVIQKHDASSLHYDFRLEIDGVLKSWAVPKGPSTDPSEKRMAIPTEDHPIAYSDFEGVIPEGEYGGGTVLVWDAGIYRNLREDEDGNEMDMSDALEGGHLTIWLEGEKISGGYALTRMGGGGEGRWLLVKMRDEKADARRNPVSTERESVLSGRTLEEVREEESDDREGSDGDDESKG